MLGSLLVREDSAPLFAPLLHERVFFRRAHQCLLRAMQRLVEAGSAVDLVTLVADLTRAGDLGTVGGPAYITALADGLPRSTNVEYYIGVLEDLRRRRDLVQFGSRLVAKAYDPDGATARELWNAADRELLDLQADRDASADLPDQASAQGEFLASFEERIAKRGHLLGRSTGLIDIDNLTCGLVAGDLTIIAGQTSSGKTQLALTLARAVAGQAVGTVLFESLEMSRLELQYRIASAEAQVPLFRMRKGYVSTEEQLRIGAALGRTGNWPLLIDDRGRLTVPELRSRCRRLTPKGLALIVVDYLQLMSGDRRDENRTQEIGSITRGLKQIARELRVPVVALSQLNREAPKQKRRPTLADLRESGSIEQDADNVWLIWADDATKELPVATIELNVAKQRQGPLNTIELIFQKEYSRFVNAAMTGGEA